VLDWQSTAHSTQTKPKNSKVKLTCPGCSQNAWGKPDLDIRCNPCGQVMQASDRTMQGGDELEIAA
jgi:ribosomal protein S27E